MKINIMMMIFKLNFIVVLIICCNKESYGQIREPLNKYENGFIKNDQRQFNIINGKNSDSTITIIYKGAEYILRKRNDSISIYQYLCVTKVNNPQQKKTLKKYLKNEQVYNGPITHTIMSDGIFDSLFILGKHPFLNNPNIKSITKTEKSDFDVLYFKTQSANERDSFKINDIWINKFDLTISGWQIKRLILQMYLDYEHWMKVDSIIKNAGEGFFIVNNLAEINKVFFFDGKNIFKDYFSKLVWKNYFPTQFVVPESPKPDNRYPLIPKLPEGARLVDF